jgi:predicted DNA-binding transcriptional regulator AlpA
VKAKRAKRFLRRKEVAERYGIDVRSVERMAKDGRIPKPDCYAGRFPLWNEEGLELAERTTLTRTVRS